MGRKATTATENIYFQCRKKAALDDDRLNSREGAAELLGLSASQLADYELGVTKFIPAESVVRMADLYKAPFLKTRFCSRNCPIGTCSNVRLPVEDRPIELVVLGMAKDMQARKIESARDELIDIASDGHIDAAERTRLSSVIKDLDGLLHGIVSLRLAEAE